MNVTVPAKRTSFKRVRTYRIEPETCANMVFEGPNRLTPVSQKKLRLRSWLQLTDEGLFFCYKGERARLFGHVGLRVLVNRHAFCGKHLQIAHIDASRTEQPVDLSLADLKRHPERCVKRLRKAGFDMPWDQSYGNDVMWALETILRDNPPGRAPTDRRRRP